MDQQDLNHIIINVRGRRFVTSKDTFKRIPESRLCKLISTSLKVEFYFDRNSLFFEYILDVYKYGTLHLPGHMCGGLLKQELQYWGIPLRYIANCCLKSYSLYLDELRIIKEITKAFANDYDEDDTAEDVSASNHVKLVNDFEFKNESFEEDLHSASAVTVENIRNSIEPIRSHETPNNRKINEKESLDNLSKPIKDNIPDLENCSPLGKTNEITTSFSKESTNDIVTIANVNSIKGTATATSLEKDVNPQIQMAKILPAEDRLTENVKFTDVVAAATSSNKMTVLSPTELNFSSNTANAGENSQSKSAVQRDLIYEKAREHRFENPSISKGRRKKSRWKIWKRKVRVFLEDPFSSNLAFIWGSVFLCIVILSVVLQCFSTHPDFRVTIDSTCPQHASTTTSTFPVTTLPDFVTVTGSLAPDVNSTNNSNTNLHSASTFETNGSHHGTTFSRSLIRKNDSASITVKHCTDRGDKTAKEILYLTTAIHPALKIIQTFCVVMFTLELLLRLVLCTNKLQFVMNIYNIVDFLALCPTAILEVMDLIGGSAFTSENYFKFEFYLGTMGVFKTLRLVKFIRHYRAMKILLLALKASIQEMLLLLLLISIGMLIFSTLIYYTEFYTQDFETIPIGFWWSIVTMTTVGYGDLQPRTGWGYLVGTMCALAGMLSTGLPIPIIANNFNVYYTYAKVHSTKMTIAAHDSTKFSKVVKLIGRISTTIKRKHPTDLQKSKVASSQLDNNKV